MEDDLINTPEVRIRLSTNRYGNPILTIKREFSDIETIKKIINSAFVSEPILVLPSLNSKLRAIQRLQELGLIVYNDQTKKYEFVI